AVRWTVLRSHVTCSCSGFIPARVLRLRCDVLMLRCRDVLPLQPYPLRNLVRIGRPVPTDHSQIFPTKKASTSAEAFFITRCKIRWLGCKDSNLDRQNQNLQSYHWTTPQRG